MASADAEEPQKLLISYGSMRLLQCSVTSSRVADRGLLGVGRFRAYRQCAELVGVWNMKWSIWIVGTLMIIPCSRSEAQGFFEGTGVDGGFASGLGGGLGALGAHKAVERALKAKSQAQIQAASNQAGVLSQVVARKKQTGSTVEILTAMKDLADFREKEFGAGDKEAGDVMLQAGILAKKESRRGDAETYLRRALSNCGRRKGSGCEESLPILSELIDTLVKLDKLKDAASFSKLAFAIEQKASPNNPQLQQKRLDVAELCIKCGDYAGAEPLLKNAMEVEQTSPGSERLPVITASYKTVLQQLGKAGDTPAPQASADDNEQSE